MDGFDLDGMISRFRERADAVRHRGLPPVEGVDRQRVIEQMRLDYQDFAMLGDAEGSLDDGILTLRVDLRPRPEEAGGASGDPSGDASGDAAGGPAGGGAAEEQDGA